MSPPTIVPFDPELDVVMKSLPKQPPLRKEGLQERRNVMSAVMNRESTLTDPSIVHERRTTTGPNGEVKLAILRRKASVGGSRPAIYYIHGGGMIFGSRFFGIDTTFEWIKQLDIVVISVEYRLAPEFPDPAPIEDCYAGLKWVGEHTSELGINPEKVMICGPSAGGGLAAGTALLVRDRGGLKICAQCLIYPMLDDRMITASSQQYMTEGTWTGETNVIAWDWYLAGRRGAKDVSIYAAPARATNLSGLPPTWIDVGAAELFRDENVAYASKLWEAGVQTELHVWEGAWHAFDIFAPASKVGKVCLETRFAWIRRVFAEAEAPPAPKKVPAVL
jgi:acetyl esterase/lipase